MATTTSAAGTIRRTLENNDRTIAWLARRTGLPYKRLLNQIKHETRPLELTTATAAAVTLNLDLTDIAVRAYSPRNEAEAA